MFEKFAIFTGKEASSPRYPLAAKKLFESKDVNCILCHIKGEKIQADDPACWMPDLMLVKRRPKPDWITRWLLGRLGGESFKLTNYIRRKKFKGVSLLS
ncbi:MAG: hypothetical protein KGJ87_01840 [Planctomycetota bacterium]|nr:hypothetical protein [Planctomycetota bacterium]MDE1889315.1 hypothetical protein [Planctomycetota bacterium]MDE2215897.1 hypothetical protein [Planctomycetota bacterium]